MEGRPAFCHDNCLLVDCQRAFGSLEDRTVFPYRRRRPAGGLGVRVKSGLKGLRVARDSGPVGGDFGSWRWSPWLPRVTTEPLAQQPPVFCELRAKPSGASPESSRPTSKVRLSFPGPALLLAERRTLSPPALRSPGPTFSHCKGPPPLMSADI